MLGWVSFVFERTDGSKCRGRAGLILVARLRMTQFEREGSRGILPVSEVGVCKSFADGLRVFAVH